MSPTADLVGNSASCARRSRRIQAPFPPLPVRLWGHPIVVDCLPPLPLFPSRIGVHADQPELTPEWKHILKTSPHRTSRDHRKGSLAQRSGKTNPTKRIPPFSTPALHSTPIPIPFCPSLMPRPFYRPRATTRLPSPLL